MPGSPKDAIRWSRLRSGGERWARMVTEEVRQRRGDEEKEEKEEEEWQ